MTFHQNLLIDAWLNPRTISCSLLLCTPRLGESYAGLVYRAVTWTSYRKKKKVRWRRVGHKSCKDRTSRVKEKVKLLGSSLLVSTISRVSVRVFDGSLKTFAVSARYSIRRKKKPSSISLIEIIQWFSPTIKIYHSRRIYKINSLLKFYNW